jgi:polyhydroxybutyrate depolymerase
LFFVPQGYLSRDFSGIPCPIDSKLYAERTPVIQSLPIKTQPARHMKNRLTRLALTLLAAITALVLIAIVAYRFINPTNGRLVSSGEQRRYLLYVPDSYNPSIPTPLVISIHGFIQWPANQMQLSQWNDLADQQGFIVVYPMGTHFPLRWRAGGNFASDTGPERDVRFISDLIDQLESEYNIDPNRIYANGMSNGGGMTFVLSCDLSERIAAVGMVAGAYAYSWEECNPSRRVPAIVFHGAEDPIVPYQGGRSGQPDVSFPSIPAWVEVLARRNGCDETPRELPANGSVSELQYVNCEADVVFYSISGAGHTWPGGMVLPSFITGHTTQDIDATQTMWDFFQQHPLSGR